MSLENVHKTLGFNPKTKREENDFYATDPIAIDTLILGGGV